LLKPGLIVIRINTYVMLLKFYGAFASYASVC
jgi:hypothetical protein